MHSPQPAGTELVSAPAPARDLAFAAVRFGWLCTVPAVAAGLASGIVPADSFSFAAVGALAALASPLVLLPLQRQAMGRTNNPSSALMFQATLQAGLVLKLAVVGGGSVALSFTGVKFGSIAVFALAFLGAAMVSQVATACHMARSLARRSPGRPSSSPGSRPSAVAASGSTSST